MQRFTELNVWKRSHEFTLAIYRMTEAFPEHERFGVTSQLRRAAVSIPSNIAEGSKRQHRRDYARFLNIAESSLAESEYLLILSRDLGYLEVDSQESLGSEAEEIQRMLNALRDKVESFHKS